MPASRMVDPDRVAAAPGSTAAGRPEADGAFRAEPSAAALLAVSGLIGLGPGDLRSAVGPKHGAAAAESDPEQPPVMTNALSRGGSGARDGLRRPAAASVPSVLRRTDTDGAAGSIAAPESGVRAQGLVIRRKPSDFQASRALTLKAGWGFLLIGTTPWGALVNAIREYAKLSVRDHSQRAAELSRLPGLIEAWETHHDGGEKERSTDEKAKDAAIVELRTLIKAEQDELARVPVDESAQRMRAVRFKGDLMLEQVVQGKATITAGHQGMHVTKIQQALADMSFLDPAGVTGVFDGDTAAALSALQRANRLNPSGVVDESTMNKLDQIFLRHHVDARLAKAPAIGAKSGPGEYKWGSAPDELTAGGRALTDAEAAGAREVIKTKQTAGPDGQAPVFRPQVDGKTYEDELAAAVMNRARAEYEYLAKGKATKRQESDLFGWDQITIVAEEAKKATDAVFGKFAVGPPLKPGVSIHDAWDQKVKSLSTEQDEDGAANWRVEKILTGSEEVARVDQRFGADQSREPEQGIAERVKGKVVASYRAELIETHKAWPAFAGGGQVNIQRFKKDSDAKNRSEMWDLFQTVVHEYLHTLEHSRHVGYRMTLPQQEGGFTLREGVVEYLTHTVLDSVTYSDELRVAVEGEFHQDGVKHPIPAYQGYKERIQAEKLAGRVGARNVMAAFFLGDVAKIGGTA